MLSDIEIAEYLDQGLASTAFTQLEELAAENEGEMAEIVAQQRIDQALRALAFHQPPGSEQDLKRAILAAACGKVKIGPELPDSIAKRSWFTEPGVPFAIICFVLVAILTAFLWFCAPDPFWTAP